MDLGWHPVLRYPPHITFRPTGGARVPARALGGGPGTLWLGAGAAFGAQPLSGTLIVLHAQGHEDPWLLLTDTPPDRTDVDLYACRHWIEQGFRGLKRGGWQWHRTRRRDPVRVARHLLALAVATLLAVAYGTRHEEARLRGLRPGQLRHPPAKARPPAARPPLPARARLCAPTPAMGARPAVPTHAHAGSRSSQGPDPLLPDRNTHLIHPGNTLVKARLGGYRAPSRSPAGAADHLGRLPAAGRADGRLRNAQGPPVAGRRLTCG